MRSAAGWAGWSGGWRRTTVGVSGKTPRPPDSRRRSTVQRSPPPAPWWASFPGSGLGPKGESLLPRIVRWDGVEEFEAALAARKGVILVSPHLGSWETFGQAVGERFFEAYGPITALFRPARKKFMAELIAGSRDRPGLQTLPTTVAGVRGLIRTLRDGGYTGLLPDQVPPLGQGVWAPFFGRPAYTMTLLPRLAQQTGRPRVSRRVRAAAARRWLCHPVRGLRRHRDERPESHARGRGGRHERRHRKADSSSCRANMSGTTRATSSRAPKRTCRGGFVSLTSRLGIGFMRALAHVPLPLIRGFGAAARAGAARPRCRSPPARRRREPGAVLS